SGIAYEGKANLRIVNLALECSSFAGIQVGHQVKLLASLVYELDLLAEFLHRRHFESPAQAIRQGEGRPHAPGIAPVDVVVRDGALVKGVRKRRIQGQRRTRARVGNLGVRDDAQNCGNVASPLRSIYAGGIGTAEVY